MESWIVLAVIFVAALFFWGGDSEKFAAALFFWGRESEEDRHKREDEEATPLPPVCAPFQLRFRDQ